MSKVSKIKGTASPRLSAKRSQFIGRTKDGVRIPRPDFEPQSFTLRELDKAIQAAKLRQLY